MRRLSESHGHKKRTIYTHSPTMSHNTNGLASRLELYHSSTVLWLIGHLFWRPLSTGLFEVIIMLGFARCASWGQTKKLLPDFAPCKSAMPWFRGTDNLLAALPLIGWSHNQSAISSSFIRGLSIFTSTTQWEFYSTNVLPCPPQPMRGSEG